MRELVKLPSSVLRKPSKSVGKIDSKIKMLAGDLVDFIQQHQKDKFRPVGLSAIQLGVPVRMFAFVTNPEAGEDVIPDIEVIINPELVYAKDKRLVRESCLSMPGKIFTLQRAKVVKIKGLNLAGENRSFRGHGLLAQCFQHELNHQDGILLDHISFQKQEELTI
jgi:peptide deformylase